MKRSIGAYRIGLIVIGLFTLILTIFVVVQASATKSDNVTYKTASTAADKLNTAMYSRSTVPASLDEVGVKNVPDTITYKKVTSTSYEFCATYKATSSGFDPSSVSNDLTSAALGGGVSNSSSSYSYTSETSLYISSQHKKGENCQTIKPVLYNRYKEQACKVQSPYDSQAYDDYYACVDSAGSSSL